MRPSRSSETRSTEIPRASVDAAVAARRLARVLGLADPRVDRPERARLADHRLVLALDRRDARERAREHEPEHERARERDREDAQRGEQAQREQRADHGLLERAQRLAREHAALELAVQALGVAREQRPDRVLAARRLEQLHGAERVGRAREQRVEQRGLLAARAVRHPHEEVEQEQHQPGRGAREQRSAPGHRARDRDVDGRLDAVARDQREVLERVRGAVGLGRQRIRGAPGRLARRRSSSAPRAARAAGAGAGRWRSAPPHSRPGASRAAPGSP